MSKNTESPQWLIQLSDYLANGITRNPPSDRFNMVRDTITKELEKNLPGWRDKPSTTSLPDPLADLKKLYLQDELLHPEGEPWEWWEFASPTAWGQCHEHSPPKFEQDAYYRRKSTSPDWDEELSPKEVAECDDWPEGYYLDGEYIRLKDTTRGDWYVWTQDGFNEDINTGIKALIGTKQTLLDHFKKRRETALYNPLNESLQQYAKELSAGWRDKPSSQPDPHADLKDSPSCFGSGDVYRPQSFAENSCHDCKFIYDCQVATSRSQALLLEQVAEKALELKPQINSEELHARISKSMEKDAQIAILEKDLEDALFNISKAEEAIEDRDNTITILKNENTLQAQILKMWEMWHKEVERNDS